MSEWRDAYLGEYVNVINGYAFKSSNFLDIGTLETLPIIKIKNVANGNVHLNGAQHHIYDASLSKYLVEKKDVLIALTGNHPQANSQVVGIASRYKLNEKALLNQRVAKIVTKDENLLAQDFIYYFLIDTNTHQYLASQSSGSANQANISKADIEQLPLSLPCPEEQKAIASVLSSLDDKIDLLQRQNTTLERMAETLFKQWFVEEAQEVWQEMPLNFYGEIVCGKTPSKQNHAYFNGDVPFIKIPDMHGNTFIFKTEDSLTELGKNSQINKTIPAHSICVSCIATVGLVSMTTKPSQTNQQINSIIPKHSKFRYFLYLTMKASYDLLHAEASGGTATLNLNTGNFSKMAIPLPPDSLLIKFESIIEPIFNKIYVNQSQIQTLEKLCDNLLPKLMSGEVRVVFNGGHHDEI